MASTITWGGSDQTGTLSGTWNAINTNVWLGGVIPGPTSDVVLNTVSTANRIVTLTGGTVALSTTISSLTFYQTSAFTNELDIVGSGGTAKPTTLTVGSTLMLGGNSTGTERLMLNSGANGAPTGNVTYFGNITVGANGVLEMNASDQGNGYTPSVSGSVEIQNGGKLNLDQTAANYLTANIKDLVLDNGATVTLNAVPSAGSGGASKDCRFTVSSSFVANTGAVINAASSSGTTPGIYFTGSSAIFKSGVTGSFINSAYTSLVWSGTQSDPSGASVFTLASDTTLPTIKISPGSTTANIVNITIGSYTPGLTLSATALTIGCPTNTSGHNGTTEVTLGSNVSLLSMGVNGQASGATIILNTNGHTLTLPSAFRTVPNGASLINWTVNGGGTVKATGFDLSIGGLASTVGANTTLFATGTYANILSSGTGGGGSIDPTSTFVLSGSTASLLSSRAIGRLQVGTGSNSVLSLSSTSAATSVLTVAGDITVSANGTLDLNGVTLTGSNAAGSNAGGLNGAGTIRNNAATASTLTIDTTAGNGSFSGVISDHSAGTGTVAFTKVGSGTQTLSGVNTYTGATTISKGTLALVGGGSIAGSSSISVAKNATLDIGSKTGGLTVGSAQTLTNNGGVTGNVVVSGTLNGTGTVTGDVSMVGGTLAPGNSPGIQTITGSLTLDSNSTLDMQLRKDSTTSSLSLIAGTDYDQVAVGGALTLAGTLNLDINWGLQSTDVFMLILNSSSVGVSGSFSTLTINGVKANDFANNSFTYNGQEYTLRYVNSDNGAVANDLELIAVPEPGTWAMFVGGLGMLLGAQRMRRRSR